MCSISYRAAAEAEGILNDYHQEAKTYKTLMNANRLNTNSFLAYMGIRALENKNTPVFISMSAPAKTDWGTK